MDASLVTVGPDRVKERKSTEVCEHQLYQSRNSPAILDLLNRHSEHFNWKQEKGEFVVAKFLLESKVFQIKHDNYFYSCFYLIAMLNKLIKYALALRLLQHRIVSVLRTYFFFLFFSFFCELHGPKSEVV